MMTLEEAIKHCKDVALSCANKECALEHFQLLKWLQEYSNMLEKQGEQNLIMAKSPQLGEQKPAWSEKDEKIKKAIIEGLEAMKSSFVYIAGSVKLDDAIIWLKSFKGIILPQQKDWSKEDERIYKSITYSFANNYPLTVQQQEFVKSLKDGVRPKQEWSALDETNLQGIIDEIEANKNQAPGYDLATYNRFLNWLKSLKDRVQPQKQEWSDVDKDILFRIIDDLKFLRDDISKDTKYAVNIVDVEREIVWLKSLRLHATWKPSDKQMKELKEACDGHWEPDGLDPLYTLYQDLKKLKG